MEFRIKEARERVGLSQKALAKVLGIKPTTFNGYETGAHDPKSDVLAEIAKACDTTVDYLLGLTENPYKEKNSSAPVVEPEMKWQELHSNFERLNEVGKNRVIEYSSLLSLKEEYRQNSDKEKSEQKPVEKVTV